MCSRPTAGCVHRFLIRSHLKPDLSLFPSLHGNTISRFALKLTSWPLAIGVNLSHINRNIKHWMNEQVEYPIPSIGCQNEGVKKQNNMPESIIINYEILRSVGEASSSCSGAGTIDETRYFAQISLVGGDSTVISSCILTFNGVRKIDRRAAYQWKREHKNEQKYLQLKSHSFFHGQYKMQQRDKGMAKRNH